MLFQVSIVLGNFIYQNCLLFILLPKLANQSVSIITNETTNGHDQNILNVIVCICRMSFLIDVVTFRECNHQTLNQACIQAVTCVDIVFEDFVAFVTDIALQLIVKKLIGKCCQMSLVTSTMCCA